MMETEEFKGSIIFIYISLVLIVIAYFIKNISVIASMIYLAGAVASFMISILLYIKEIDNTTEEKA